MLGDKVVLDMRLGPRQGVITEETADSRWVRLEIAHPEYNHEFMLVYQEMVGGGWWTAKTHISTGPKSTII